MGYAGEAAVIGAGPAGALSAYLLARAGTRVTLFDAKTFPRTKPCGGGIQERTARHIPFEWQALAKAEVDTAVFTFRNERPVRRTSERRFMHCVLRREFDNFLVGKAVQAGARLNEGEAVLAVRDEAEQVGLETKKGSYVFRYAIGADGANGVAGRGLNRRSAFFWQAALYAELPREELLDPELAGSRTMRVDLGTLGAGYAWAFPKGEHLNVGVGGPVRLGRGLRSGLEHFMVREGALDGERARRVRCAGHQLPTLTRRTRVAGRSLLLAGDAAGLVEPLTGEGISYALHSARLAAECVLSCLQDGETPQFYAESLARQIGTQIRASRWLLSFATAFPDWFYRMIERREDLWNVFCRVLCGDADFPDLRGSVAGPLARWSGAFEPALEMLAELRIRGWRGDDAASAVG